MGGPSDRQFDLQPGIHVTPRVDYGKFDPQQRTLDDDEAFTAFCSVRFPIRSWNRLTARLATR